MVLIQTSLFLGSGVGLSVILSTSEGLPNSLQVALDNCPSTLTSGSCELQPDFGKGTLLLFIKILRGRL